MYNIKTKYKIGQRIHYIEKKENNGKWITCPACNGNKTINKNGYKFRCCTCDIGKIWEAFYPEYEIITTKIEEIEITLTKNFIDIKYITENNLSFYDEGNNKFYSNKKEALKKLKKLKNKK